MNPKGEIVGYHTYWNKPRKTPLQNFELLLTIASAVKYRQDFGPIKCFMCSESYEFYKELDLLQYYDGVEMLDEELLSTCNSALYFAAGKIVGQLQAEEEECMFVDQDLIITRNATEEWELNPDVSCFHRETNDSYPWLDHWKYDGEINDALPINGALTLWRNKELRREYAGRALRFMVNNDNLSKKIDANTMIITAEQKVLGMFLQEKGITPTYYIQDVWQTIWNEEKFVNYDGSNYNKVARNLLHLWGAKKNLAKDNMAAAEFTLTMLDYLDALGVKVNDVLHKFTNR